MQYPRGARDLEGWPTSRSAGDRDGEIHRGSRVREKFVERGGDSSDVRYR